MTSPRTSPAKIAAIIALFGGILVSSIILVVSTDMNPVVRGVIALGIGLIAAFVAYGVTQRVTRRSSDRP